MAYETVTTSPKLRQSLLDRNEDHFTDFKSKRIAPAKLQETFVAFANADGGEIFVGLEDKKFGGNRVDGFKMQEDANSIIDTLLTKTEPSVEGVDVEFLDFGHDGLILHITIPKSPQIHFTADKTCYMRLNASSPILKGNRVMQLAYSKGSLSYERNKVSDFDAKDIVGSPLLADYLKRIDSELSPHAFLKKLLLVLEDKGKLIPTVACILLFDEEPQATLASRCAVKVYRLHTTDSEYKREHLVAGHPLTIEGNIESQIFKVIEQINEILKEVTIQVRGKFVKVNYPAVALRELIINAIIHRDYSLQDDIHIKIYDNRIEITSPGKLPGHVTKENILEERFARNPTIVRLLHKLPNRINFDIGEGMNTAFNAMHKAGLKNPTIEEDAQSVKIIVAHKKIASLEEIILEFLEENDTVTNRDVRRISGEESVNKVKKAFQKLRREGLIEIVDQDVDVFYYKYKKKQNTM